MATPMTGRPALDKHTRPHSLHSNCVRSGSILSPFRAALFVYIHTYYVHTYIQTYILNN